MFAHQSKSEGLLAAECLPADILRHKAIESKMQECLRYHFLLNNSTLRCARLGPLVLLSLVPC